MLFIAQQVSYRSSAKGKLSEATVSHEAKTSKHCGPSNLLCGAFLVKSRAQCQSSHQNGTLISFSWFCLLSERCFDAAVVSKKELWTFTENTLQTLLWLSSPFLAFRFHVAAVDLWLPDLFGHDQSKRIKDEKNDSASKLIILKSQTKLQQPWAVKQTEHLWRVKEVLFLNVLSKTTGTPAPWSFW